MLALFFPIICLNIPAVTFPCVCTISIGKARVPSGSKSLLPQARKYCKKYSQTGHHIKFSLRLKKIKNDLEMFGACTGIQNCIKLFRIKRST